MILLKNCKLNNKITDILISDKKIIGIDKYNEKSLIEIFKDNLKIIDINNDVVIPGFIDNHVHLIGGGGESGFSSRISEMKLKDIVSSGVTTVVGVLGTDSITKNMENLLSKVKQLNNDGITAYCLTGSYEYPSPTLTGKLEKDISYIDEIIGVKIAISDHRCYNPTKDNLIEILSKTRVASLISGKKGSVNFHIGFGKGYMDVLEEIINDTNIPPFLIRPTHISCNDTVFSQALSLAKCGSFIDITANSDYKKVAKYIYNVYKEGLFEQLTMSSDAGGSIPIWKNNECLGFSVHTMKELLLVIKELVFCYNIPLEESIKILTSNVSNALGLYKKGKIEIGYDADILVLDESLNIKYAISNGNTLIENYKYKGV